MPPPDTAEHKQRPQRTQKAPPTSHLIYNGKLCTMFLDHTGRNLLVVLPKQAVSQITDLYPVDLSHLLNECRLFCDHYRIRSFTTRIHRRDWEYSPHAHIQITMPKVAYDSLVRAIGFTQPTPPPPPGSPPPMPAPSTPPTTPPTTLPEPAPATDAEEH